MTILNTRHTFTCLSVVFTIAFAGFGFAQDDGRDLIGLEKRFQTVLNASIANAVALGRIQERLEALELNTSRLKQDVRTQMSRLNTLCGEAEEDQKDACAGMEKIQADLEGRLSDLSAEVAAIPALTVGGNSSGTKPDAPSRQSSSGTSEGADDGTFTSQTTVVEYIVLTEEDGRPVRSARGVVDDVVLTLPEVADCTKVGAWFLETVENAVSNAFFVNNDGVVRICKLIGDGWHNRSAGRNDKAHVIVLGEGL